MKKAEFIGIPIKAVAYANSRAVLAESPRGTPDMFYISCFSSAGSELLGCHLATQELVKVKLLSAGGYGCRVGSDGAIYIGGVRPGNLYRYEPATGKLESLGGAQFGVSFIWDAAASADGKVYGACFPTCSVIEYDIAARTLKDLGRLNASEQMARAICVDHKGKVWVGIGARAHLVTLDPRTGAHHDVLPQEFAHNSMCYNLNASGPYVLCSVLFDGKMLVFDADTEKLVRVIPAPSDSVFWMNARGAPDGEAYLYNSPNGDLYRYDIKNDKLVLLAPLLGQCEWVAAGRYVHGINDQDYFRYDLSKKKVLDRRPLTESREGMNIFTLTGHSCGRIYGSAYINQHIFVYDPTPGKTTDLGKVVRFDGQVDSIHSGRDGKIYMGSYTMACLSIYDPSGPWRPGRRKEDNPRELGAIGKGQYRTKAIALGPDGNIYVGSIPEYNTASNGGFTRWNAATGEHKTWTDLAPGGAVEHIAVDGRFVYCAGGGVFFVWSPEDEKKIYEEQRAVFSLCAAPNGKIVGNSGTEMFVFDPQEMKIVKTFVSPIGEMSCMTVGANGKIYGINRSAVGEIESGNWTGKKIAAEGGSFLAADKDHVLYFARGPQLYRLK